MQIQRHTHLMARPAQEASQAATSQITGCSEWPKQWHYASAPERIIGDLK